MRRDIIKPVKILGIILVFSFFVTLLLSMTGYYQTELQRKMTLTNESVSQFEEDLASGKDVSLNDYLDNTDKNYDNTFSNTGRSISDTLSDVLSGGIKKTIKVILKALEE